MKAHIEQTGSFIATDERGGRHWLLVFTEYARDPKAGKGVAGETERGTSIRTAEGKHVERLDKGRYRVVETGVKLASDDPNAP